MPAPRLLAAVARIISLGGEALSQDTDADTDADGDSDDDHDADDADGASALNLLAYLDVGKALVAVVLSMPLGGGGIAGWLPTALVPNTPVAISSLLSIITLVDGLGDVVKAMLPKLVKLTERELDMNTLKGRSVSQVRNMLARQVKGNNLVMVERARDALARLPFINDMSFKKVYLRVSQ